jgi:hypothetical protein
MDAPDKPGHDERGAAPTATSTRAVTNFKSAALAHDPEKCEAVFRKDHSQTMN